MLLPRMAVIVYALFADEASANEAERRLQEEREAPEPRAIQVHRKAPLDGNILPEGATEFGRNLIIAMIAGAVFMTAAGGIAGAMDLVLGMSVGMGMALGFVTGLLMGMVGAMQAGTRIAKAPLLELEPEIHNGRVLLLTEVESREVDAVVETLERHRPISVSTLDGL